MKGPKPPIKRARTTHTGNFPTDWDEDCDHARKTERVRIILGIKKAAAVHLLLTLGVQIPKLAAKLTIRILTPIRKFISPFPRPNAIGTEMTEVYELFNSGASALAD